MKHNWYQDNTLGVEQVPNCSLSFHEKKALLWNYMLDSFDIALHFGYVETFSICPEDYPCGEST